ncbi:hypothetical protein H2200_005822 [Cladophialophora chaetospira]|uniref:Uncharacterized protein n=1 Tax=Cladophialophora chaetospira TaxID=386627 RepID=A0AA39CIN8_9EURO|nr:hypothetical protein H2200_005822 [Cladophialophora chaetospira]
MAITTSSSTKATVRRSARRQRKAKHPGQRLGSSIPTSAIPRQGSKRRKVRNHDSEDLEGYYYACGEHGYRHDPLSRHGSVATSKGNRYWLLEADITDPTMNTEEAFPLLEHPEPASQYEQFHPGLLARTDTVVVRERKSQRSLRLDQSLELPPSLLPSLPTTPYVTPRVKLPYGNPPSSVDKILPAQSPGYLDDIEIPSPLLYHNLDDGYVPPSNNAAPCWGIPYFEYAYGQARPQPDFTSYRPVAAPALPRRASVDRRESLGFALGGAASSRHKAEESHISNESHDSSTHGCPLPRLSDAPDSSSQCKHGNDFFCESPLDVPLDPEWSWAGDVPRPGRHEEAERSYSFPCGGDDLVYPTLPTPAYIRDALAANYMLNNVVQPWANQAAGLWDLASPGQQTLTGPCIPFLRTPEAPSALRYLAPLATGCESAVPGQGGDLDLWSKADMGMVTPTGTPKRPDLVPARLYQHQFIAWPATPPISAPYIKERTPSDVDIVSNDSDNVLKMLDWLVDLNTAVPCPRRNQDTSDSPSEKLTEEIVYQCCEEVATPGPVACGSHGAMSCEALHPDDEALHFTRGDEDYATTSYHDPEAELLSESKTDDEWAYWDWGTDSEDDIKSGFGIGSNQQAIRSSTASQQADQVETHPAILWGILQ